MTRPQTEEPNYQPLGEPAPWGQVPVDTAAWDEARAALAAVEAEDPDWAAMVGRGALLAAAFTSTALSGQHEGDDALARSLLTGQALLTDLDARSHVEANYLALQAAGGEWTATEAHLRHLHAVACRPQQYHAVGGTAHGGDHHALAHGDYKHHPSDEDGSRAHAPVALVGPEVNRFVRALAGADFADLHPATQAAYALHGLDHIRPFAAGNGRVGRVVASHLLLAATSRPLVLLDIGDGYRRAIDAAGDDPAALVGLVERQHLDLMAEVVRRHGDVEARAAALARWRQQAATAQALPARLATALPEALKRHRRQPAVRWRSDLAGATVTSDAALALTVSVPNTGVDEELVVDAHPVGLEPPAVLLSAHQAGLDLTVGPDDDVDLGPWLDRVVSALAVRTAAAAEPER
ncbi:MAG: Fic family protein [Acidimicrobiales bacterium]